MRSLDSMARSWGWGIKRVRNFLSLLEEMTMIETKGGKKGTQISILNYNEYQTSGQAKGKQRAHKGHARGTQGATKKECIKECKKERLQYVKLPIEDYERLCLQFGKDVIDSKVEDLETYIGIKPESRTKKYSDHNKVIRSWLKKDGIKPLSEGESICPQCKKRLIQVNGLCEECNEERMG